MVISNGAGHEYTEEVDKYGCQTKKLSIKVAKYFSRNACILFTTLLVIFTLFTVTSCAWNASHTDQCTITEIGLKNVIAINMSIDEVAKKGIAYTETPPPYQKPDTAFYKAEKLGIEFETLNREIIRIWFFSHKNNSFKLFMPKESHSKSLSDISANDIIRNFGKVIKYEDRYPPKGNREAVWSKNQSFGIATNTIDYPGIPYHFGLNWDDTLSYVAVSKIN